MAYKIDASLGVLNSGQATSQLVRTSTGNLYATLSVNSTVRVYKSTNNGLSWAQQDYGNSPRTTFTIAASAIDGMDAIHILYRISATQTQYIKFSTSTDTFGSPENAIATTATLFAAALAVDTNNIPHVAATSTATSTNYANRIGGTWSPSISIGAHIGQGIDLQIDNNNLAQISYVNSTSSAISVAIANKNNASSFTVTNVSTAFTTGGNSSLAIDAKGNTWVAFQGPRSSSVQLAKHIQTDPWSTWQTPVASGYSGKTVSLAADANDIYVFYERNAGGIAYDRYDTVNGNWLGEQIIQTNTPRSTTNLQYHNPFVKWSQYFNNGDTGANNQNQDTIEYIFDDGSTIYYDKLVTAQIATGFAEIKFSGPAGATTTSTSSTSSSTSTSISTSSTSSSTSVSTSSTSSSISTSTSLSTSSTSSSTSKSTSTSSTSSSTSVSSTSSSISTSSTSSSISTSSTSSSTSTSKSTSTSSTSQSTSQSTSTSSTSSSISTSSTSSSISTSSTSSSVSTSSTSSSTSRSTSTSSTSASTSVSTTTSSTSSSISTSSTSSSVSTSSTSSSISTSTSQSTSTSVSTSTSSTSSSTSLSTSSTSSSVSTSSTSRSTSTSSTSSSTSQTVTTTSTSSTSSSTSTSVSTSSTSSSTSISTSSTSRSTSTSSSISTSSTSSSISTSTSHSTSSTSISTSSTSQSTSTSTTLIDVNTFPRAHIPNIPMRYRIYREKIAIKRTRGRA